MNRIIILVISSFFLTCQLDSTIEQQKKITSSKDAVVSKEPTESNFPQSTINRYAWLENYDIKQSIVARIPTPFSFERVKVEEGSFEDWLRHLPLKEKDAKVYLFNGDLKFNQNVHAAVVNIDIGNRDLQQCADAVMRLKSEYHFSKKDYSSIHFNYTSGDQVLFDDWRKGRKPKVQGNKVVFTPKTGHLDNSYSNFQKYLIQIFSYAGTASLEKEMKTQSIKDIQIGDVFIQGGFPGHAVIVVDMAANEKGEKVFLLAQSYMPAQSIHLLKNPMNDKLSPWYSNQNEGSIVTPEWTFQSSNLKSFE